MVFLFPLLLRMKVDHRAGSDGNSCQRVRVHTRHTLRDGQLAIWCVMGRACVHTISDSTENGVGRCGGGTKREIDGN